MSSVQDPVPQDESQAENFGLEGAVPSRLELPVEDTSEAPSHTKQQNMIDPNIMMQFLLLSQFTWKSTDAPGSALKILPVHPKVNKWLEYLMGIYNAWTGSIDFQLLIAGTGFNGGKLGIAKIPPNINANDLGVSEYTCFPYMVLDVKSNGFITITGSDQRPIAYHYTNQVNNNRGERNYFSLTADGGTIVIFVLNGLISASGNNTEVSVSLFTKPGNDFQFSQLLPPLKNTTPSIAVPRIPLDKLYCPNMPFKMFDYIKFNTNTIDKFNAKNGCYDRTKGDFAVDWPTDHGSPNFDLEDKTIYSSLIEPYSIGVTNPNENMGKITSNNPKQPGTLCKKITVIPSDKEKANLRPVQCTNDQGFVVTAFKSADLHMQGQTDNHDYTFKHYSHGEESAVTFDNGLGESIVTFGFMDDDDGFGCLSPAAHTGFHKELEQMYDKNITPIYEIVHKESKRPQAYLRANPQGYFTTNKRSIKSILSLRSFDVVFHSLITTSDNMPNLPASMSLDQTVAEMNESMRTLPKAISSQFGRRVIT